MVDGWSRFRAVVALLLPLGSSGVSTALASTSESVADPAGRDVARAADVAGNLQAIREAVSRVTIDEAGSATGEGRVEKAWWGNWHRGWGWHNGGWRNGGWGWRNGGGWPNWHNGGWGNGWRNW